MHFKHFTRLFLLMGMIGLMSAPLKADEIQIGSGTSAQKFLPTWAAYEYSYTQQIYLASEIANSGGGSGDITSISFFYQNNPQGSFVRTLDLYLVNTSKDSFSSDSDWIRISNNDKVFSGQVTFKTNEWNVIDFSNNPFSYTGENLAVIIYDKSEQELGYERKFSVFDCEGGKKQSIGFYCDDVIDLSNPNTNDCYEYYDNYINTYKNQIKLEINMAACAVPRSLTISDLTATSANLSWTAGGSESTWEVSYSNTPNNPNGGTKETVSNTSYSFSELIPRTTYYVYVRAKCSSTEQSDWSSEISFKTLQTPVQIDADHPFYDGFENGCNWVLVNGTIPNQWCMGTATSYEGNTSLYISNDGEHNAYSTNENTMVYATKNFHFEQEGLYNFSYNWKAKGESLYDYLRVALVPADLELEANTAVIPGFSNASLPSNWIPLDGGSKLNESESWNTKIAEVQISTIRDYKMVFAWRNNNSTMSSGSTQPPAAIDGIQISISACPMPKNLSISDKTGHTAVLNWEKMGNETQWQISYGKTSGNPDDRTIVSTSEKPYTLQELDPTSLYYVSVRAICGTNEYSDWSNEKSFWTEVACATPTNIQKSSVTSSSATITWTSTQEDFHIQYKKTTENDWGTLYPVVGTSYTITGLRPTTSYDVRVRSNCGGNDGVSDWVTKNNMFTTECGVISEFPFSENFNSLSSNQIPNCWDNSEGTTTNSSYKWCYNTSYGTGHSGKCVRFDSYINSSGNTNYLKTPSFDFSAVATAQLNFWYKNPAGGDFSVYISTDGGTTYGTALATGLTGKSVWTEKSINLNDYIGSENVVIVFKGTSNYGNGDARIYLDDVTIEAIPSCQIPTNLQASEITDSQAILTWNKGENESKWDLEITIDGSSLSSSIRIENAATYTMETNGDSEYRVRIRAVCNENEYSEWSEYLTFTTPCGIYLIDTYNSVFEDFNGGAENFPPSCWQKTNNPNPGATNGWHINYLNNLDSQGALCSDWKCNTYLILPQLHISHDAKISFDHLFGPGSEYAVSSIVISTTGSSISDFTQTIWSADASNLPSSKTNVVVSIPETFDGQDVYLAFKYQGNNSYSLRLWYIDNVQVYVPVTQNVTLSQGWNWWSPTVETSLEQLEAALGDKGVTIMSQNSGIATYDDDEEEWSGSLTSLVPGQMYLIQVNEDCSFILSGSVLSSVTITIEQGSNWFGYTGMQSVTIEQALNGFAPAENDRIFSFDEGFSTYDGEEWSGTFSHLRPGHGYIYISQDGESKTINF